MIGNIVLIKFQFSVVVGSMEKGLKDLGYNVSMIPDTIGSITEVLDHTDVFIAYLPDTLTGDDKRLKNLHLIIDRIKDGDRRIILIGNDRDRSDFMKSVPSLKGYAWFDRPVDMHLLTQEIDSEIKRVNITRQKKKILIIDDDPVYSRIVSEWLKGLYDIETVNGGMQAITYLSGNKVDLILLDYEMPVVDGPKILEMLKMHPDTQTIPVMFLTGVGTKESISRVKELKPQGYILKTTTREKLLLMLKGFFNKQAY